MRSLITIMSLAAAIYVGLCVLLYLLQGRMVYLADLPGRTLTASPADIALAFEDVAIDTADGERLHGWFVPAAGRAAGSEARARGRAVPATSEPTTNRPAATSSTATSSTATASTDTAPAMTGVDPAGPRVVLFFHGNAGNISHRLDSLAIFHALGLDILIVDYRGYGQSTGAPTERGTYRDAEAAWNYLTDERGIPPQRIVVFGRSLGGAVGAWLASRVRPGGVIIESAFTSGADMAKRLYPFLPARLITRLRYPVIDYVRRIEAPLLVVHSRDDEIIPFDMGQALYRAAPGRKAFLELRGDHNTGFLQSREAYVAGLRAFLAQPAAEP